VSRETVTDGVGRLEAIAQRLIEAGEVPGLSFAIVHRDEVVALNGFGVRLEGGAEPVDADTVFQLASLSKPIASTVVAAIVHDSRGKVTWDSRASELDPALRFFEPYVTAQVTIGDLFAHRSGLSGNAGNDLESLGFPRDEILHRLRYSRPASSFRSTYDYSNFGLTAAAVAAAKGVGLTWEDAAESRLFARLGMSATSARHRDFLRRTNRASLHVRHEGRWTALAVRDADAQSPAGGISSTARDLAQWMRLELAHGWRDGESLIAEEAIGRTHVPLMERGHHPLSGVPSFYGLGWNVEYRGYGTVWGHAGAFSQGARTLVGLVPSAELGVVALTNAFPTGVPDGLADTFLADVLGGESARDWVAEWNAVYASLFGPAIEKARKTYGHSPPDRTPALALAAYTGTYTNDYLGSASVIEENGTLILKLGPAGARAWQLRHFDRDVFVYYPFDETPEQPVAAAFAIGPDRRAHQLTLDDLNDNGQGVLTRRT
jgi:CubicO group peptidase (beta-lactamase class C family)